MSGFDKRDHFTLIVDFELVLLCKSTVDELSVALCFASLAALAAKIRSLSVQNYAGFVFV